MINIKELSIDFQKSILSSHINMTYEPKNFDHLLGTEGFSDQLLKNHFTLYQGYVTNTNKLLETLETFTKEDKAKSAEFSELTRRLGWEFNGMRLHELYFSNMSKEKTELDGDSNFFHTLEKNFGGYEAWEQHFKNIGSMRGIGWTVLYYDKEHSRLLNTWINEHDIGHLAGCAPILVMDVFEHAFITDYGLQRADYIQAFFRAIDWNMVSNRL